MGSTKLSEMKKNSWYYSYLLNSFCHFVFLYTSVYFFLFFYYHKFIKITRYLLQIGVILYFLHFSLVSNFCLTQPFVPTVHPSVEVKFDLLCCLIRVDRIHCFQKPRANCHHIGQCNEAHSILLT